MAHMKGKWRSQKAMLERARLNTVQLPLPLKPVKQKNRSNVITHVCVQHENNSANGLQDIVLKQPSRRTPA